ncbi:hypothetical protein [Arthrobacter sp. StoSoilB22]|uniref:hypothetical protein n=1 Tax=Arthrobacter sp. StoSoilB22 TaxID=2830996 RepID=UPI001CC58FD9|nr:hypothetical protein [Arthrobacter sp. StoSoilB22]BCW62473.1 hypothetical protein StoSoilB22_14460 [Arthrobacter sp. StoSoilB22]
MGIFSKSPEAAQAAVTKAEQTVAEWERKASDARAEAARMDGESGAAILEDESAAERITLNVQTLERKARAFDQAAAEARNKLLAAQKDALEAEAREEHKEAAALRKKADTHDAKVAALLGELEKLDDCRWDRAQFTDEISGRAYGQMVGLGDRHRGEALRHETRGAVIGYFIATGKVPSDFYDINNVMGTTIPGFARSIHDEDNIPQSVLAARDAGLNLQGA